MPQIFGGFTHIWGTKHQILDHFFATSALDTAYLKNDTSHRQTKVLLSIYDVSFITLKADLLSIPYFPWPLTQKRLRSVTHRMKIQNFPSLSDFPHKGHWTQANQILPHVRELKGLTIHCKNFGGHYVATVIVFFFRRLISEVTERISTKLGHICSSGSDRLHLPIIRRSTVGSRTFTELFRRRGMEQPAGSRHSCAVTCGLQTAP